MRLFELNLYNARLAADYNITELTTKQQWNLTEPSFLQLGPRPNEVVGGRRNARIITESIFYDRLAFLFGLHAAVM